MGRIYKRGRVWYIDVYASGQRIRKRVGTSKKIALLALQDSEVKVARNEFGFAQKDIAVNEFLNRFIEHSKANHREKTTNRYHAVINHFQVFLKIKYPTVGFLSQVTTEVIDRYKVTRKEALINPNGSEIESENDIKAYTRKGARSHTINFEVSVLRTIFNLAVKWGYLRDNPTRDIKKLKVDDSKPVRFLSNQECQRLLNACPEDLYPIYFTFLNSGMRKAELENLEWDDVDFKRHKLKIHRKEFWQPKTGEREIPMNQSLSELMAGLKQKNNQELQSNFVFPHKDGGKIKIKLREKLIEIAERAKVENLTKIHTLRHTFASHLVMSGVDLPTVKKLMGHSDIQTTMIYAHLAPDHLAEAVDRLSFKGL